MQVCNLKQGKKVPQKIPFPGSGAFTASVPAPGDDGPVQAQGWPFCMKKPVITLCTSCFNRYISSSRLLKFCWTSEKCISADLGKYFPETMSGLVGRGLARSSRILLSGSAIGVPSNLRITAVKGLEHCQHLNFSSSCSAGARLYTERHEWVTFTCNYFFKFCVKGGWRGMVQRQGLGSLNMLQMLSVMWSLLNCLSRAGRLCSMS